MAWQSTANLVEPTVSLFLCGDTGSGKTAAAATFPRPLFIFPRNENSQETLRGRNFPFEVAGSRADMDRHLDFLIGLMRSGQLRQWCDTVVLESMSHYSQLVEMELTDHGSRDMKGQWGFYTSHFQHLLDVLFTLKVEGGVHVLMTAQNKLVTKGDIVIDNQVQIYGQTAKLIASSFDALGYMEALDTTPPTYRTHFRKYNLFPARTRIRGMPSDTFQNFNFTDHVAPFLTAQDAAQAAQ